MSNEIIRLQNLLTKLNNLFSLQEYPTTSDKIIDINDGISQIKPNLYFQVTIDNTTDFYNRLNERMTIAYDNPSDIPRTSHITLLAITINYNHHKTQKKSFERIYNMKCSEIEDLLKKQIMSLPFKQTRGEYDLFPDDNPRFLVKKMELINKNQYTDMITQVKEILQQGLIKSEWKKNITINTTINTVDKQSKGDGLFVNDQLLYFISEYYLTGEQWKPHISVYKSEQGKDDLKKKQKLIIEKGLSSLFSKDKFTLNDLGFIPKCRK